MDRRLAAILAADVVGYSRLMGRDEPGTLALLKRLRRGLIEPKRNLHHGRIIKLMGDGVLMEFASAVDAVAFAVDVQCSMRARNTTVPEDNQIVYRVGINVGDIIADGDDIFGDGVNIASRLERLSDAGGVCVARNVYNRVKDKLDLTFESLGERVVKNIAEPVSIYRVVLDERAEKLVAAIEPIAAADRSIPRIAALGLTVLALLAGLAWWYVSFTGGGPTVGLQSELPKIERPSLVVLPFVNMSGSESQEYFADGITEDLTTDLSKLPGLFVVSRNSAFRYKGQNVSPRKVSHDLGISYILQGSIRRAGDRVRINAQLVDASTEENIWAERFNKSFSDIFVLQDEVIDEIIAVLSSKIPISKTISSERTRSTNPKAYDLFLQGQRLIRTAEYRQARQVFEDAIRHDPAFARAYSALSVSYTVGVTFGWSARPTEDIARALELAGKAVSLGGTIPQTHWALSFAYLYDRQYDAAQTSAKRAVSLDPGFADGYGLLAWIYDHIGEPKRALATMEIAKLFDPHLAAASLDVIGMSYLLMGDNDAARKILEQAAARNPHSLFSRLFLISTYMRLGLPDEAEWQAVEVETLNPDFSIDRWSKSQPIRDEKVLAALLDDFRKAGLQ